MISNKLSMPKPGPQLYLKDSSVSSSLPYMKMDTVPELTLPEPKYQYIDLAGAITQFAPKD